ncbi:MAG TPA: site-2 protease family protein [Tissierellales bacterium]|nr:site-2 protease family protein [Tissierellales bacterium]
MVLNKIIALPGLFMAIIFHEVAHGYTAYKLGDPTAKNAGRLTLNPIKHIDLTGFLFLLIFKFGWAKPVPVNSMYFKHRKRDMILVSLAGPLTNFLLALVLGGILSIGFITNEIVAQILIIGIWYNIMLGIFNLLPFPPLDGSKVVASLLPTKYEYFFYENQRYLSLILIILILTNSVDKILSPLIDFTLNIMMKIFA